MNTAAPSALVVVQPPKPAAAAPPPEVEAPEPQIPQAMVTLSLTPDQVGGEFQQVGLAPAQLMPAQPHIHGVEDFVPAGTDPGVAMKIARARAGVAVDAQPQIILKDPQSGALFVTGTLAVDGAKAGAVQAIDGAALSGVKSVTATKEISDVQAVVGGQGYIPLSDGNAGQWVPFPKRT